MFNINIGPDPDVFQAIRSLPGSALEPFGEYVEQDVLPALRQDVNDLLAPYPGHATSPFEFTTLKSRKFFFYIFKHDLPYQRSMELEKGWRVRLDRRTNEGYFNIFNEAVDDIQRASGPSFYANYVYPPLNPLSGYYQVPGHARTGWGAEFPTAIDLIREHGNNMLIEGWYRFVQQALAG